MSVWSHRRPFNEIVPHLRTVAPKTVPKEDSPAKESAEKEGQKENESKYSGGTPAPKDTGEKAPALSYTVKRASSFLIKVGIERSYADVLGKLLKEVHLDASESTVVCYRAIGNSILLTTGGKIKNAQN